MSRTNVNVYGELPSLFFETRQIIRESLPGKSHADPNTWMHLETLRFIGSADQPTMQEVANFLRIKAPSATSLINNLFAQDLLVRTTGQDKRVVRLSLSAEGKRALKEYGSQSAKMMKRAFSKLEEQEVCTLGKILKRLVSAHSLHKKSNNN